MLTHHHYFTVQARRPAFSPGQGAPRASRLPREAYPNAALAGSPVSPPRCLHDSRLLFRRDLDGGAGVELYDDDPRDGAIPIGRPDETMTALLDVFSRRREEGSLS